jgi:type I restriction enzyme S subunit
MKEIPSIYLDKRRQKEYMERENKNIPQIRFPGFKGDWECRKLSEVAKFGKGRGYSKGDLEKAGTPIILYGRLYTKYETSIREVDTFVTPQEDSVYSCGGEVIIPASGETSEDIARASTVENAGIILGSDLNIIKPIKDINSSFLALSISNGQSQKELAQKSQGKSIVHIHNEEIKELVIPFPNRQEQDAIVVYFSNLDNLITLSEQELNGYKELKKCMLQKMFPKDGESVPEIRFPGFVDEWEQLHIEDICTKIGSGGTPSSSNPKYYNGDIPFLNISDIDGRYIENTQKTITIEGLNNSTAWIVPKGSISFAMYASVGKVAILSIDAATSQAFLNMVIDNEATRDYLFTILEKATLNNEWEKLISTGTQRNLNAEKVKNFIVKVPSLEEQQKIGLYFKQLDNLISISEQELNEYKRLKKCMLQKMFC